MRRVEVLSGDLLHVRSMTKRTPHMVWSTRDLNDFEKVGEIRGGDVVPVLEVVEDTYHDIDPLDEGEPGWAWLRVVTADGHVGWVQVDTTQLCDDLTYELIRDGRRVTS